MIALLAPVGLVALAALLVPLLVHLVRRSDEQVLQFAAMRFLRERHHPRERLRLHERLLLALRLLLVAGVALLLAIPVWRTAAQPQAPWVVVAPGISADQARAAVAAPLAEWHRLAPQFPPLEAAGADVGVAFSSMLRDLDERLPAGVPLTVVVPEELAGLDAERLRLAHRVDWRILPGRSPNPPPGAGSAERQGDARGAGASEPLRVSVRYDAAGRAELGVARALAAAWQARGITLVLDVAARETPLPPTPGWLIWVAGPLSPAAATWIRDGGRAFASRQAADGGEVALADEGGTALLRGRELGAGRLLSAALPLETSEFPELLEPQFARTLWELLAAPVAAPDRAAAADVAPRTPVRALPGPVRPLDADFAIAIALLFLIERLVATRLRTAAPAAPRPMSEVP